jgi:hypothetical protein
VPVTVTVDYSAFKARMGVMRKRGHDARAAFVLAMGSNFLQNVVKWAPVDTNRYVRAWLEAGKSAGMSTSALPPIINSRRRDDLLRVLSNQVIITRRRESVLMSRRKLWYEDSNRPKRGYYHKLNREIDRQRLRAEKAEDTLREFQKSIGAIVMMRGTGAALNGYEKGLSSQALNATTRTKVYGGRGRLAKASGIASLWLHNREPHCRVVEKYRKVVARAQMALRAGGIKRMKPVYVSKIAAGVRDAQRSLWFKGGKGAA